MVHGGFLGPWSWDDVARALDSRGIEAVVPALPSMGDPQEGALGDLYADAAAVRRVLDSLSPPVLLCGHSYGGAVITEAAAGPHPAVAHLVYVAAAIPDVGESLASVAVNGGAPAAPDEHNAAPEEPIAGPGGSIVLPPEQAVAGLFHDCSSERAREAVARLRPMNPAVGTQALTGAAWHDLPSTLVRCTQDRVPELVTAAYLERGPEIVEVPAGHCPNWTRPELIAQLLATRVERLVAG